MSSWPASSLVVLLVIQLYSSAALNIQENGWVTKHLTRSKNAKTHTSRQLGEYTANPSANGFKAHLIDSSTYGVTDDLTVVERIHRDVDRSRARAASLDTRSRNAPYGNFNGRRTLDISSDISVTPGSYSMEFSIGTPPQDFVAIADTGSDLVWLQCTPCDICFESKLFDPSQSTTYAPVGCPGCEILGNNQVTCTPNCQYSYSYGDQSTTEGDFSTETITLTSTNGTPTRVPDFQFGCGRRNNGSFSGTDGLVGLARGPISFPSQIAPILNGSHKFSYCLLSRYEEDSARSPLIFGELSVPSNITGLKTTPILTPYPVDVVPYYYVNLIDITLQGVKENIPAEAFALDTSGNGGVIFDSGTTYTLLNTIAYQQIITSYTDKVGTTYTRVDMLDLVGLEVCYDITDLPSVSIPRLTYNFECADFDLPFENIMIVFSVTGTDTYMCLALLESSGFSIFGNVQQQNFQVLHDQDNLVISWVEMDCNLL